jgi:hypothetical protein
VPERARPSYHEGVRECLTRHHPPLDWHGSPLSRRAGGSRFDQGDARRRHRRCRGRRARWPQIPKASTVSSSAIRRLSPLSRSGHTICARR